MSKVGGLTSKFYRETRGIKVTGGQAVTSGTILTRRGDRWKPGINVNGQIKLTALCDGEVYFTKKRGVTNKTQTYIHIRAAGEKVAPKKKAVAKKKTAAK